ncbi:MAG: hypothetical protein J1E57_04870 [Prevotella sp.]|nr:hypothetical protein [Prevotella sp.]
MNVIERTLNAIASFRFCLYFFTLKDALKRPIQIHWKTKVCIEKNTSIEIKSPLKTNMVKIGFTGAEYISSRQAIFVMKEGSKIIFENECEFGPGVIIYMEKNSQMIIGDGLYANTNCTIRNTNRIVFEDHINIGWNSFINTSDGHEVSIDGFVKPHSGDIFIRRCVWITSNCTINKNTEIGAFSIVGQHSIVGKKFEQEHVLIAGCPAKVVKSNVLRLDKQQYEVQP